MPHELGVVMRVVAETYKQQLVASAGKAESFRKDHARALERSQCLQPLQQLAQEKGVPLHLGHLGVAGEDHMEAFINALDIQPSNPYGPGAVAKVAQHVRRIGLLEMEAMRELWMGHVNIMQICLTQSMEQTQAALKEGKSLRLARDLAQVEVRRLKSLEPRDFAKERMDELRARIAAFEEDARDWRTAKRELEEALSEKEYLIDVLREQIQELQPTAAAPSNEQAPTETQPVSPGQQGGEVVQGMGQKAPIATADKLADVQSQLQEMKKQLQVVQKKAASALEGEAAADQALEEREAEITQLRIELALAKESGVEEVKVARKLQEEAQAVARSRQVRLDVLLAHHQKLRQEFDRQQAEMQRGLGEVSPGEQIGAALRWLLQDYERRKSFLDQQGLSESQGAAAPPEEELVPRQMSPGANQLAEAAHAAAEAPQQAVASPQSPRGAVQPVPKFPQEAVPSLQVEASSVQHVRDLLAGHIPEDTCEGVTSPLSVVQSHVAQSHKRGRASDEPEGSSKGPKGSGGKRSRSKEGAYRRSSEDGAARQSRWDKREDRWERAWGPPPGWIPPPGYMGGRSGDRGRDSRREDRGRGSGSPPGRGGARGRHGAEAPLWQRGRSPPQFPR